jgi:homoserine/homoserine lactone efflux protein
MIDTSILVVFIPTFFCVCVMPGLCMTLSLTLGMTIGVRRTFCMIWGELIGVGLVAVSAVLGVAAIMLNYPHIFTIFKLVAGMYLFYLGIKMWCSKGKITSVDSQVDKTTQASGIALAIQGFLVAVSNPKAWAFFMSLLPPFIDPDLALTPQLSILVGIILFTEFCCLVMYANGGKTLGNILYKRGKIHLMNRITGTIMLCLGLWMILG